MRQVWKYLVADPKISPMVPAGSRFLHFANQNGDLVFWAEVDNNAADAEIRHFAVYNTGQNIDPGYVYRGTASVGPIVWHLYEYAPEEEVSA
jgi:hypothetical protein